jgi:hypothetical protein
MPACEGRGAQVPRRGAQAGAPRGQGGPSRRDEVARQGRTKQWSRPRQWQRVPMRQSVHGAAAHRERSAPRGGGRWQAGVRKRRGVPCLARPLWSPGRRAVGWSLRGPPSSPSPPGAGACCRGGCGVSVSLVRATSGCRRSSGLGGVPGAGRPCHAQRLMTLACARRWGVGRWRLGLPTRGRQRPAVPGGRGPVSAGRPRRWHPWSRAGGGRVP